MVAVVTAPGTCGTTSPAARESVVIMMIIMVMIIMILMMLMMMVMMIMITSLAARESVDRGCALFGCVGPSLEVGCRGRPAPRLVVSLPVTAIMDTDSETRDKAQFSKCDRVPQSQLVQVTQNIALFHCTMHQALDQTSSIRYLLLCKK